MWYRTQYTKCLKRAVSNTKAPCWNFHEVIPIALTKSRCQNQYYWMPNKQFYNNWKYGSWETQVYQNQHNSALRIQ